MDEGLLKWLIRLGVLFGAVLFTILVHWISRKLFRRANEAQRSPQSQRSLRYVVWGIALLLYVGVAYFLTEDFEIVISPASVIARILQSFILLGLSFFFYGLLPILLRMGRKSSLSMSLSEAKRATLNRVGDACLRLLVLLIGLSAILSVWGINISGILTGLGIGSLAVALAAQNLLSNLIGGATLVLDKPFEIGDGVVIGDLSGSIEEIGWRSTRIRSYNDEVVTMPNSKLMDSNIVNISRMGKRRINLTIEVGGTDAEEKIELFCERLRQVIESRPLLQKDSKPYVAIQNLRWGGYQLLLRYYIGETDYSLYLEEVDRLLLVSTKIMKEMGLTQVYAEKSPSEKIS